MPDDLRMFLMMNSPALQGHDEPEDEEPQREEHCCGEDCCGPEECTHSSHQR